MNRRAFVRALMIGAAGAAVPEPIRTYFLPPVGGWRPQTFTPAMIEAIRARLVLSNAAESSLRLAMRNDLTFYASDPWPSRIDVLYGWATLRSELACRIVNVESIGP